MTTNQIQFLANEETARHNRAVEEQGSLNAQAQMIQAEAARHQATSSYITALASEKQAEAAMNQSITRQGELQYQYDTLPLREREVAAKEKTAEASATTADANATNAQVNKGGLFAKFVELGLDAQRIVNYSKEVANSYAKNELEKKKLDASIQQYMYDYALAKSDLERKKVNDKWDRIFKSFDVFTEIGRSTLGAATGRLIDRSAASILPGISAWFTNQFKNVKSRGFKSKR